MKTKELSIKSPTLCHCGLNSSFEKCCGVFLCGDQRPQTAEQLMRSRYSAYVIGKIDYIEGTCYGNARAVFDATRAKAWSERAQWLGLEVRQTREGQPGDERGWVEFVAHYRDTQGLQTVHELSEFQHIDGRWYYIDGQHFDQKPTKISRNDPCPCKSGKKYKRCCGC